MSTDQSAISVSKVSGMPIDKSKAHIGFDEKHNAYVVRWNEKKNTWCCVGFDWRDAPALAPVAVFTIGDEANMIVSHIAVEEFFK